MGNIKIRIDRADNIISKKRFITPPLLAKLKL